MNSTSFHSVKYSYNIKIPFLSQNSYLLNLPSRFASLASSVLQHLPHYPADYSRKRVVPCNVLPFSPPLTVSFYHHWQSFLKPGQLGTVLSKPQMAFECKPHEMQVAQGCSCCSALAMARCGHTLSLLPSLLSLCPLLALSCSLYLCNLAQ